MDLSILDAVLNGTPTSDPAALLEIIAEIPSARPAALYTLSSVLAALHTESTLAGKNGGERGGEHAAKRQRTDGGGGGGAAEENDVFSTASAADPDGNIARVGARLQSMQHVIAATLQPLAAAAAIPSPTPSVPPSSGWPMQVAKWVCGCIARLSRADPLPTLEPTARIAARRQQPAMAVLLVLLEQSLSILLGALVVDGTHASASTTSTALLLEVLSVVGCDSGWPTECDWLAVQLGGTYPVPVLAAVQTLCLPAQWVPATVLIGLSTGHAAAVAASVVQLFQAYQHGMLNLSTAPPSAVSSGTHTQTLTHPHTQNTSSAPPLPSVASWVRLEHRKYIVGYLIRVATMCPTVLGPALPTMLAAAVPQIPTLVHLESKVTPTDSKSVWCLNHEQLSEANRPGAGASPSADAAPSTRPLVAQDFQDQLRAPTILNYPQHAKLIASVLGRLSGVSGLETALAGGSGSGSGNGSSSSEGDRGGSGGAASPGASAAAAADASISSADRAPTMELAHKILLDLLVSLRRGLAPQPPASCISARSFIRMLRQGVDSLCSACLSLAADTEDGAVSNSSAPFRLLELVGAEGGMVVCGSVLAQILLQATASETAGSSSTARLALWLHLLQSYDLATAGSLEACVEATLDAALALDAEAQAAVLGLLGTLQGFCRPRVTADIGARITTALGKLLLPMTTLACSSGSPGSAAISPVSEPGLELLDRVVSAGQVNCGRPALQRLCTILVEYLFSTMQRQQQHNPQKGAVSAQAAAGAAALQRQVQHVLWSLARKSGVAGLLVGLLFDEALAQTPDDVFVGGTAGNNVADSAGGAAKYSSLLGDNAEGFANRGGYFYTGKIGRGLKPKATTGHGGPGAGAAESNMHWENVVLLLETLSGCMSEESAGQETLVSKLTARLTPHTPVPPLQAYRDILPRPSPYPRDQLLARSFDSNPLLWHLLLLGAENPANFARGCFDLAVGLLVTAIARWHSFASARERVTSFTMLSYKEAIMLAERPSGGSKGKAGGGGAQVMPKDNANLLTSTMLLLDVFRMAKLAPAPLCNVGDVASFVNVADLVKMMMLLFKYASENPPSPSQFTYTPSDAPANDAAPSRAGEWSRAYPKELSQEEHLGPLQAIFIANMESIGPLYGLHFGRDAN